MGKTLTIRRVLLGRPIATDQASHERLPKRLALAVFSSDALSSVAYATEEILRVLLVAGTGSLALSWPIALGIAILLVIVAVSYRQTIFAYPNGGGAYIVAKENLGDMAGLVAAASLLIDYVLTVSVSVAAGVDALTSAVQGLHPFSVWICLGFIILLTVANLRGLKESGSLFAIPTYSFIASMFVLVAVGIFQSLRSDPIVNSQLAQDAVQATLKKDGLAVPEQLGLFLLLRAFASGCTALTGVEAISNGIPAFKKPESKNAAATLTWMAAILTTLFLGITWIANHFGISALPEDAKNFETVISQVAAQVFGRPSFLYYFLQFATTAILVVAANTSYADFPRLASLLARDRFLPRQLGDLGDKLVYNNGIIILAAFAGLLIIIFKGSVNSLIPLYAVGVFTSFSLSQAGMVHHWFKERGQGWYLSALMNGLGAIATTVVLLVIGVTKFNAGGATPLPHLPFGHDENGAAGTTINYGAWMVIALVPFLVLVFRRIRNHYRHVEHFLKVAAFPRLHPEEPMLHTVIVLVPNLVHSGILMALNYARSLSMDVRAVHVEMEPASTPALKSSWEQHISGIPLIIVESPFRTLSEPLVEYVEEVMAERNNDTVTVIIPELVVVTRWWHRLLHNSSAASIRRALGRENGVVITTYRYFADVLEKAAAQNDSSTLPPPGKPIPISVAAPLKHAEAETGGTIAK